MAFRFVLPFAALLAMANAGAIITPVAPIGTIVAAAPALAVAKVANPAVDAVASTQQNVLRTLDGTVSHYSKSVDTPYSSVRKVDSRITNNVYTPAVAKTLTTYAAPAQLVAPVATYAAAAPLVSKTVVAAAPVVAAHAASPLLYSSYAAPAPAVVSHVAAPAAAVAYSPAVAVAHVAFDGFGTHWGY